MIRVKQSAHLKVSLLIADILILLICTGGLYLISIKADLPVKTFFKNDILFISENSRKIPDINPADEIISINDHHFTKWEEVELYLDGKRIGENINLELKRNGTIVYASVQLTKYYDLFNFIIIVLVGITFYLIGVFVRIKAPDNYSAYLFHWACIGLGMVIMLTAGCYRINPIGFGQFNRIMWLIAYSLTPVLFIHFTSSFPKKKVKRIKYILWYFYLSAVINAIILSYLFLDATIGENFESLKYYVTFFDSFFRLFLITCIFIAISICIYAYRATDEIEERKRLQWLLLGFFIGPFSFVIFWVIPIFLTGESLIPESLVLIFLTAIPITFSIAIVKYHLMNINLLIRRSSVYVLILSAIVITYIILTWIITRFVVDLNPAVPAVLTAIATVVLLQPLKNIIQKFVDKKFFKVEYDFREEQRKFLDDIKSSVDIQSLSDKIVSQVDSLIPVDNIGFFILSQPDNKIKMIANRGWDILKNRSIRFESENLKTDLSKPVAVDDRVEPGLKIESADVKVFKRWGIVLVFPVKSPSGIIHAFIALGTKKSGARYFKDDVDLLNTVATAAALAIERIKLQEELILEHIEAQRLQELNEVKSLFVSTMVHELKQPLSGIKIFTDLLQDKTVDSGASDKKYLSIIDGESQRLKRMINNILDNAMIEKGMKNYQMSKLEINSIIKKTVSEVEYMFGMKKQKIEVCLCDQKIFITGDKDAIESMLMNLITNANKYSPENTRTLITTSLSDNQTIIEVRDEGKGIPESDLENIFQPYIRIKDKTSQVTEGTGLGLSIVKHIVEAHNGKIELISEVGKGSTFTLIFPTLKNEEDISN